MREEVCDFRCCIDLIIAASRAAIYISSAKLSAPELLTAGDIDAVALDISGGYNGDLYAFLSGPNGGFAVLLNRVGVSNDASSFGYGNHGFDIVLSDSAASDVHYYQSASYLLNGNGQLTGTWVPDGRNIGPQSAPSLFGSTAPSALLSSFNGTDPNGGWTLFLADLSVGSQSQLVSWSLDIITVPEPSGWALGIMGLGLLAVALMAVALVLTAVGVAGRMIPALVPGLILVGISALMLTRVWERRSVAVNVQRINEARSYDRTLRRQGRVGNEEGLRVAQSGIASILRELGVSDVAAAENILAAEQGRRQEIATLQVQVSALLAGQSGDSIADLRDRAALEMEQKRAALAALDAGKLPLSRGYIMTEEDKIRRTTIMRLMCDLGLDYEAMSSLLGLNFREHFAHELESLDDMEADGLLVKTPQGLIVTDLGRLLIRNIAMRFDAYASVRKENRFSRTI